MINQQPSNNQNLSAKELEQIKEMQKWEQIRKQRREENGIPEPGMQHSSPSLPGSCLQLLDKSTEVKTSKAGAWALCCGFCICQG